MYFVKTPKILMKFMPEICWHMDRKAKEIFLTFDDGPIPELTPWVLDQLKEYDAKATFFSVGENFKNHPEITKRIILEGHSIGNHTYNHLKGWKTSATSYIENFQKFETEALHTNLFRPPHGKIKSSQRKEIIKTHDIVMWDILSGDFDQTVSPQQCAKNVIDNATNGSIIVFHDNIKATNNLKLALPATLKHFSEKGFSFCKL
ncbi:MAG: peptidoglycan/xylan/chitin deacetylase (PgdA/CDA1 family) [Sphingobacteriales bacterium]|jgi:peptidoglycan/xylan/chitin deacetylase (PgdA/CDA1 family)